MTNAQFYSILSVFAMLVGCVVSVVLYLVKKENDLKKELDSKLEIQDAVIEDMRRVVTGVERELSISVVSVRQEVGEVGAAIRTKMHEIEVFVRDTFISKTSFEAVLGRLERTVERGQENVDKKIDKIDNKIDGIVRRFEDRRDSGE